MERQPGRSAAVAEFGRVGSWGKPVFWLTGPSVGRKSGAGARAF